MAIYTKPNEQPRQRGSKKGNTFTRTANGFIIRKRFMPTIVRNARTTRLRAKFLATSSNYRNASQNQKGNFASQASLSPKTNSLGQTYYLSGQQRFNSQNQNRLIDEAPVSFVAFPDTVFPPLVVAGGGISTNPPNVEILITPDPIPSGFELIVRSPPIGYYSFSNPPVSLFRIIRRVPTGYSGIIELWDYYTTVFGAASPKAGQAIFLQLVLYHRNSGQQSTPVYNMLEFP